MDRSVFYTEQNFSDFSIFWKVLIVIGSISIVIFLILLLIIVSLLFESKTKKEDISEYNDFLNEFKNGVVSNEIADAVNIIDEYPILPKIKDFDGNILKNLLQIEIIN